MKKWFVSLSIRAKLILIILMISFVIVALVGGARIAWDLQQARQTLAQEVSALTRLLGNRSSAAVAFDDALLARENLNSLRELPHIMQACLYRADGSVLAKYQRTLNQNESVQTQCPPITQLSDGQAHFEKTQLHLASTVRQGTQSIGWIYLDCDLSPIKERLHDQIIFSGLALLAAILFSGLLAAWLQRLISEPIRSVIEVAQTIEEHGNHNLRAPVTSQDEVGKLATSFNAMLDALEIQNRQLITAKAEQQSESLRFQSLVESTSAIPWELDLSTWRFIFVGHQAEIVFGYPLEDWYQDNFWVDHLHPDDRDASLSFCQAAAAEARDHQFEYRMLATDGRVVWIHDDVQVISEAGQPVRLQGFMFDISSRKKMEDELRHHRDQLETQVTARTTELETANKELESFSYSISHDLRAPLRSISSFSQIILEDHGKSLDGEAQKLFSRVITNANRMSELIDDLLKLSRLGREELHRASLNFDQLTANIIQSLKDNDEQRSVEFTCGELGSVTADPQLLKIVIENVLGNAWKYTSKIDNAHIIMGKEVQNDETIYFVKDNGAGFNMEYADKIFGAFQRLHKQDEFEGTGIGLATVQRIIHRHGGRIWAESELGKGASFYFTLTGSTH